MRSFARHTVAAFTIVGIILLSGLVSGNEAPPKGDSGNSACMDAPEFNDCNGSGMNNPEKW
jgi:hypothetical protein